MKTRFLFWLAIFIGVFFLTPQLYAQFYKYTDKNGNTAFTDDLTQVPIDQRPNIKSFTSYESKPEVEETSVIKEEKLISDKNTTDKNEITDEDFIKQRESIEKEYAILIRERDKLSNEKDQINTPVKQEKYNQKVVYLNKRIEAFKLKIREFNNKVSY